MAQVTDLTDNTGEGEAGLQGGQARVGIIMGSKSDLATMQYAARDPGRPCRWALRRGSSQPTGPRNGWSNMLKVLSSVG